MDEIVKKGILKIHNKTDNKKLVAPIIFTFSGRSNSGKTTLICRLCDYLKSSENAAIAVVKHDPKDKAEFDIKGKDSYHFFEHSSAVAVVSPSRTTLQIHHNETACSQCFESDREKLKKAEEKALVRVLDRFLEYDYIFIEGFKTIQYPRIVVARGSIDEEYIPYADAFAIDESIKNTCSLPKHMPILHLNNIEQIVHFIHAYSRIKE